MRFFLLSCLLFSLVSLCLSHPTLYPEVHLKKLTPGEIPAFRSYHVHFLFEKTRASDDCTGYDDAIRLRTKFQNHFNVTEFECQGTFDQGQMCAFPVSLGPFGPFVTPEFAFFIPYQRFHEVVQWVQQNHQQFSTLIHPNSGYEREDHSIWALWSGTPKYLDLTLMEFSEQLAPSYNTSCRNEPAEYPFPDDPPTPSPSAAHVRLVSMIPDTTTSVSVTLNGAATAFPTVKHLDQTYYSDFNPQTTEFCAVFSSQPGKNCVTQSLTAGATYTLIAWNGQLLWYEDDDNVAANEAKIRVINLLGHGTQVAVRRDGEEVVDVLKVGQASLYDSPKANAQHQYDLIDLSSGKVILTLPYFTNARRAETIVAIGGLPSEENAQASTILLYDGL